MEHHKKLEVIAALEEGCEDVNEKGIFVSGENYSTRQLIKEINKETELGKEVYRMYFEYKESLEE
jgi:hypothetical protein